MLHRHDTRKISHIAWGREFISISFTFGTALVVAVVVLLFVFQSYQVSGQSMEPTLQDADRLVVWKLPRTWARLTGNAYIPNRGDIVIVNQSDLSACGQEGKQIIKRVVGLPGEKVVIAHNTITVFNQAAPNGFQPDTTLPYGHAIREPATQHETVTLGQDQLFVAGDNRTNSCDSRFFGPIQSAQIIGKLLLRAAPLNNVERF